MLSKNKIEYLLYHLNHHFILTNEIRERLVFDFNVSSTSGNKIFFLTTGQSYPAPRSVNAVPILFPLSNDNRFFYFDKKDNLVFGHDYLSSAFWLLSGQQEFNTAAFDKYGRYKFSESIQSRFDFIHIPVVDIYFRIISDGIREYCKKFNLRFEYRNNWNSKNFGLIITHDVDRVDKWIFREIKLRAKLLFKSNVKNTPFTYKWKYFTRSAINFFSKDNPYWNFDYIKKIETKYQFKSTWHFLPRGEKNIDAFYSFSENRIRQLAKTLSEKGDEIALHATYDTMLNIDKLKIDIAAFRTINDNAVFGNRQHWLRFKYPETLKNLEACGIIYDSSWHFATHPGWRNSYSMPFRPYDLAEDRIMNIWEVPLCIMDTSLFEYQNMDFDNVELIIKDYLQRIKEINGLLVLLWHNSYLDEEKYPGIHKFYEKIMGMIKQANPRSVLPLELIQQFTEYEGLK